MTSMRLLLTAHVVSSVGWLGAVLVFLAHAVVSAASDDAFATRAAAFAMGIAAWAAVMPLALASLATASCWRSPGGCCATIGWSRSLC